MTRGDMLLTLARDRLQEQIGARDRMTTKASIAFSALGVLATVALPEKLMGHLAYGSLFGMYICTLISAFFLFRTLSVKSYSLTPVLNNLEYTQTKPTDEELKFIIGGEINQSFDDNTKNMSKMSKSFSYGFTMFFAALVFRMIIELIPYLGITL